MYYYKIAIKKTQDQAGMPVVIPIIPDDIEYRELHQFPDGMVIETKHKLANILETYIDSDPIIKSHVDWWQVDPKSKMKKGKIKDGKFIPENDQGEDKQ